MKNKNVLILVIIAVLIVLVAAGALIFKSQPKVAPTADNIITTTEQTGAQTETEAAEGSSETDAAAADTASSEELTVPQLTGAGYVYITAGGEARWFELPAEEGKLNIRREAAEGEDEVFNIINLSPNGAFVESASCDNQDCVEQGMVTLENKTERVLQNLIVCLPNEVSVELYSAEEVMQMMAESLAAQAQETQE